MNDSELDSAVVWRIAGIRILGLVYSVFTPRFDRLSSDRFEGILKVFVCPCS